jgi:hypothetical protein
VGGACGTRGRGKKVYRVLVGKPEGHRLEDQGVGVRMGLEWTLGRLAGGGGCVECIHLVQDRDRWQAVVNAVMNLQVLVPRS